MKIIGMDLSGPSNPADTVCVMFDAQGGALRLTECICGATDQDIVELLTALNRAESVIVGLDAPLSYNPGGGDRPSDKDLRRTIVGAGLHPGSVMTPTMTKMAYLTLRGMGVARLITNVGWEMIRVLEVHPGATMALGGAAIDAVKALKSDIGARHALLNWLEGEGLQDIGSEHPSDHYVAACACALAAWKWSQKRSAWLWPACTPHHPYAFAC